MQYFVVGDWTVRGGCTDVGDVLHRGGTGGDTLQYRVVGHVPMDWKDSGGGSPPGDVAADRADATAEQGLGVYITPPERGNSGGGISRGV